MHTYPDSGVMAALGLATRCAVDSRVDPETISWGFSEADVRRAREAIVNTTLPNGFMQAPDNDSDYDTSSDSEMESNDSTQSEMISDSTSEISVDDQTISLGDMSTILTSSGSEFDFYKYESESDVSEEL